MVSRGLLAKIMRSPELMAALGLGGAGVMTSGEDENEIARGIAGAGIGLAAGRGLRGLLGRVAVNVPTQQDKIAQAMAMRRAMGLKGSQASQFPSGQAMTEAEKFADMIAMEKYGDKIGMNGVDRTIEGIDQVGKVGAKVFNSLGAAGSKVWDGVDKIAHRAAPIDRVEDLGKYAIPAGLTAATGGAAYTIYELVNSGNKAKDEQTRTKLLAALGVEPTPTGLMMFQAQNGIRPSGEWDEPTIMAIAKALEDRQGEDEGPPAPSLAPHNQR